jgi:hypothetical protein
MTRRKATAHKYVQYYILQKRPERFGKGNMDGESLRDIYSARRYLFGTWNLGRVGTTQAFIYFLGTVIPARGRVAIIRYRSVRTLDESPPGGQENPLREDHAVEDLDRG